MRGTQWESYSQIILIFLLYDSQCGLDHHMLRYLGPGRVLGTLGVVIASTQEYLGLGQGPDNEAYGGPAHIPIHPPKKDTHWE